VLIQDTLLKKSPVIVNERLGFDELLHTPKESVQTNGLPDKRSPFGVTEIEFKEIKSSKKKGETTENSVSNKQTSSGKELSNQNPIPSPRIISAPKIQSDTISNSIVPVQELKSIQKKERVKTDSLQTVVVKPISKKVYLNPKQRNYINQDGLFILFIVIALLIGWINIFHRKRLVQLLNAFFITRIINQLIREENSLLQRVFTAVSILFVLVLTIFSYQAAMFYKISFFSINQQFLLFIFCILAVSIIYFSKFVIISLVSYLFDAEKLTRNYFYNTFLINNFVGLILLPIILLIAYNRLIPADLLIKAGAFIFIASFIYRITRGVVIAIADGTYSVFHILLYLCTLEILPILFLIKLIKESIKF
jgi:hypothetical protein